MKMTFRNPYYHTGAVGVDIDLEKTVLHTTTGERMTEAYFQSLADEAERAVFLRVNQEREAVSPRDIKRETVFA
jgi:hypothetical protein